MPLSTGAPSGKLPASMMPPSNEVPGGFAQTPFVDPIGSTHGDPVQQSAFDVQAPETGTHAVAPQRRGAPPSVTPVGTQGRPQQSMLVEQTVPDLGTPASHWGEVLPKPHRGIPRASWRQDGGSATVDVPEQQSARALHETVANRQMSPLLAQPPAFLQRPTGDPPTPSPEQKASVPVDPPRSAAEPQQSESARQSSSGGWHPSGGWQISTPVARNGAQARLQQLPPHAGTPPSDTPASAPAPHTNPAIVHPPVPGALGTVQSPMVAKPTFVQRPPQQSLLAPQLSPVCPQYDGALQTPALQNAPQHSLFVAHVLPKLLHVVVSGAHVLPVPPSVTGEQTPPQHWAPVVQAWLSDVQSFAPQVPPLQTREQQSPGKVQTSFGAPHEIAGATHLPEAVSQLTEQQVALVEHVAPIAEHVTAPSPPSAAPSPVDVSVKVPSPMVPSPMDASVSVVSPIDVSFEPSGMVPSRGMPVSSGFPCSSIPPSSVT